MIMVLVVVRKQHNLAFLSKKFSVDTDVDPNTCYVF